MTWAFISLDFALKARQIRGQLNSLMICKPNAIIWLTFQDLNFLLFYRCFEIAEGLFEEFWHEKEGWPLIEALGESERQS
jgi:ABC-type long-subunit fatty acid transport system fused permease/ATPase subunit